MKKSLLILFGALLIFQGGLSYAAGESSGFFQALKNAIIRDVEDTVQTTVTTVANKALNQVKRAQYKKELEQKKQELADLEASNKNFIVKFFQRRKLNKEIQTIMDSIENGTYEGIEFPDDEFEIASIAVNNSTGEIVGI